MHELRKIGLRFEIKPPLQVIYDGVVVGEFFPDAVVESCVILELKGVERIAHEVQLVNYLQSLKYPHHAWVSNRRSARRWRHWAFIHRLAGNSGDGFASGSTGYSGIIES